MANKVLKKYNSKNKLVKWKLFKQFKYMSWDLVNRHLLKCFTLIKTSFFMTENTWASEEFWKDEH